MLFAPCFIILYLFTASLFLVYRLYVRVCMCAFVHGINHPPLACSFRPPYSSDGAHGLVARGICCLLCKCLKKKIQGIEGMREGDREREN